MIAVLVVVLIVVGLPLLAWWVGGRRFWSRPSQGTDADSWRAVVRRHGLTPPEAAQVESAVVWGRGLTEPRLRAAAVAWAEELLDHREARRRGRSRGRRIAAAAAVLVVVVAAVGYVGRVRPDVPWVLVCGWLLLVPVEVWAARGPARALRLNRERAADQASPPAPECG